MMGGKWSLTAGILFVVIGIAMLVVAATQGDLNLAIFVIFPIIVGEGVLPALGGVLIFAGLLLIFFSFVARLQEGAGRAVDRASEASDTGQRKRYGGVLLIGPLPIIFGSDKNVVLIMAIVALVILVAVALLLIL